MSESKIRITTSGMSIVPYEKKQCPHLENMTSMKDFGCKFRRIETTGFNLGDRFVTHHLPKFFLENYFGAYDIEYVPANKYTKIPKDINWDMSEDIELRSDQFSVVNSILQDIKHNRWFVHCPQGFGKTLVSIYIMTQFRVNTMVMCYSVEILKQWKKRISEDTNIDMSRVLIIDDSQILKNIIDDEFPVEKFNIFLATPTMINSIGKKISYDKMNLLFQKMNIGLKIYDEAHRNLGNMIKIDASTSVKYTLYLSGDFAQAGKYRTALFQRMFDDVIKVKPDMSESPNLKYTQAIVVEYNSHPSEMDIMQIQTRRGMSIWNFMDYQIQKGKLLEVIDWIIDHIISLKERDRRILLLTSKVDHCEYLYRHIKTRYDHHYVGIYHGEIDQDTMEDTKNNAQIIIATYSSFSTGIDTKNIKYVISSSASNRIEDSQASGRARPLPNGEDCFFWMLVDTGFEHLAQKEKERVDYLYQLKVKEVTRISYDLI